MTTYQIRYEGPATVALRVATALADAEGVDLRASDAPRTLDAGTVQLAVTVDGGADDVLDAVGTVRGWLPVGASIEIVSA